MSLADVRQLVTSLARDQAGVTSTEDRDRAIALAVARYSADVPRQVVEDITWPANGFVGSLPEGWFDGAAIVQAETPLDRHPPSLVPMSLYQGPEGARLIAADALDAGVVVRVTFRAPHILTEDRDTVEPGHVEALASYAAHLLCKQLASHFSAEREAAIGADASATDSRARNYAARAKDYRGAYYAGIGRPDPQASGERGGAADAGLTPAAAASAWESRPRVRPSPHAGDGL
jgi:hypothetical protein